MFGSVSDRAGLRDKNDLNKGLYVSDTNRCSNDSKQITVYDHLLYIDTRDFWGQKSLEDTKTVFYNNGGRPEASGIIKYTTGEATSPITVTTSTDVSNGILKNGDYITITGVQGNNNANGSFSIFNLSVGIPNSTFQINGIGNKNYAGGGMWSRQSDLGYPNVTNDTNLIRNNQMFVKMNKKLKAIRSASLLDIIIPRDIIPIEVYIKDLFNNSTNLVNQVTTQPYTVYDTYIPLEYNEIKNGSIGFYSTPIYLLRSYSGVLGVPDQVTPPPLELWNPPVGNWPNQPLPYPFQTVPTYRSNNFDVNGKSCYLILSGYGLYDFNDWAYNSGNGPSDRIITDLARKLLLIAIIQPQMYNDFDQIEMILNCNTTSSDVFPYGYGDFQRFVPGPGLQQNYQPGTSDSADPTVVNADWPINFPNFLGNVWGPYDTPGNRFQKMGLKSTIQDLYLNGDLMNLFGNPIIKPDVAVEAFFDDPTYGINFDHISVTFSNIQSTSNPNILNAMRLTPNGFGAQTVRATGSGTYYNNKYQNAGGTGPSDLGTNGAWSLTGVYGTPSLSDPIAVGSRITSTSNITAGNIPQLAQSNNPNNYPAQDSSINARIAWYDKGPNQGSFISDIEKYKLYLIRETCDTNVVVNVFQIERDSNVQYTRSNLNDSIISVPVHLTQGFTPGNNFDYIEPIQTMYLRSDYNEKRFLTPKASLDKLIITLTTYDGTAIPLEKMLLLNKSSSYIEIFENLFTNYDIFNNNNDKRLSFLFDPLNPELLSRTKHYLSIVLKFECYQYVNPGLNIPDLVDKILSIDEEQDSEESDSNKFQVRASNYINYS
jgi:hypothetical protein